MNHDNHKARAQKKASERLPFSSVSIFSSVEGATGNKEADGVFISIATDVLAELELLLYKATDIRPPSKGTTAELDALEELDEEEELDSEPLEEAGGSCTPP